MNKKTKEALELINSRYKSLDEELSQESIIDDIKKFTSLNKEKSLLIDVYEKYNQYLKINVDFEESKYILDNEKDFDLRELAKIQYDECETELIKLEKELDNLLIPKDINDEKNVIVEIRGAAGGDEANIFAGDLYRMYCRYSERNNWKITKMDEYESEAGGFSQVVFMIKGKKVFSKLKFESGAHRVQRVPKTESKGRIQTSTATVAVLPEATEVEVDIKISDLRIDTYRSSGAGGQHVNTTDSAVRITHIPTGAVASSQDGRSQHDNKDIAMTMLRAKIYETEREKALQAEGEMRKNAVGTGMRSEKIRTYNFPDNRVTDHRINMSLNKLDRFLDGDLDEIISELINDEKRRKIEENLED